MDLGIDYLNFKMKMMKSCSILTKQKKHYNFIKKKVSNIKSIYFIPNNFMQILMEQNKLMNLISTLKFQFKLTMMKI